MSQVANRRCHLSHCLPKTSAIITVYASKLLIFFCGPYLSGVGKSPMQFCMAEYWYAAGVLPLWQISASFPSSLPLMFLDHPFLHLLQQCPFHISPSSIPACLSPSAWREREVLSMVQRVHRWEVCYYFMACFQDGGESPVNCAWSLHPPHLERIKPLRILINYSRASFVQPVLMKQVIARSHSLCVYRRRGGGG